MGSADVEGPDGHGGAIRPVTDGRSCEGELDPAQVAVGEDRSQGGAGLPNRTRALVRLTDPGREDFASLTDLVTFVERARYDRPFEVDEAEAAVLVAATARWCALLGERVPRSRRVLARVAPISLLPGRAPTLAPAEPQYAGVGEVAQ